MTKSPDGKTRFKALDGLRGLAVLQVIAFHYYLSHSSGSEWYLLFQRAGRIFDGLTLFFVLSGFLIGGILLDSRMDPGMLRRFFIRRFFRIMPLYFLLLATYGLMRWIDERMHFGLIFYWYSDIPFWTYLLFCQNYRMVHDAAFGAPWLVVTWSLAVEQQFYLIAPFVVRHVTGWRLAGVCAFCAVAGAFLRQANVPDILLRHRLDALATGVLLAIFVRTPRAVGFMNRGRRGWRLVAGIYLLGTAALRMANVDSPLLFHWTIMALFFALVIHLLLDETGWPVIKPAIESLAPIGLVSYFLYLFHVPVLYLYTAFFPRINLPAAAFATTVVLASISYRYFERPLIKLGYRF